MAFDAIMVRQTAPPGSAQPIDLGHLAEAMLFYRTVRMILTRWSASQLILQCGPDLALEIVANTNVDAICVDQDVVICSENVGTARERHWPLAMKTVETHEAMIVRLFREATGKSGKGRRLAQRFLAHTRAYELPVDDLTEAVGFDWQDSIFMAKAQWR